MRHVEALATRFPHRHAGDPEEALAAQYIASEMKALGLRVRVLPVPVMGWEVEAWPRLEVRPVRAGDRGAASRPPQGGDTLNALDAWQAWEAVPFIFSGSTPAEGLEGRLIPVGITKAGGFLPWSKFALVDGDGTWRAVVAARPDGPAIAQSGPPEGVGSTANGPHYTWPAVVIGQSDLGTLQDWLGRGEVEARLHLRTHYRPDAVTNVVEGELTGRELPEEVLVAGAHHDCQGAIGFRPEADSPGAADNASGVAAVLEMARILARRGTRRTLRFCTWGGEERNFIGSRAYVRRLSETGELERVRAYLNLDQSANGINLSLRCSTLACSVHHPLDMEGLARHIVKEQGLDQRYPVLVRTPPQPTSDHAAFYEAGVPVLHCSWSPMHPQAYHRQGDTPAYCDRDDKYEASTGLVFQALLRLDDLPRKES